MVKLELKANGLEGEKLARPPHQMLCSAALDTRQFVARCLSYLVASVLGFQISFATKVLMSHRITTSWVDQATFAARESRRALSWWQRVRGGAIAADVEVFTKLKKLTLSSMGLGGTIGSTRTERLRILLTF